MQTLIVEHIIEKFLRYEQGYAILKEFLSKRLFFLERQVVKNQVTSVI